MPSNWTADERRERAYQLGIQVDPEDEWLLFTYTWDYQRSAIRTTVWCRRLNRQQHALLHHCIVGQPIDGSDIDHIDRDIRNNKRSNLRYISHARNALNSPRNDRASYIVKTANGHLQVEIRRDGTRNYIGNFQTYEEAERARDKWLSEQET